jgi:hypothetical protein
MNAIRPMRMAWGLRAALYSTFGILWLSGVAWLLFHGVFEAVTEFGRVPSPWEPQLMRVHGLVAVPALFLLGWMNAIHIIPQWRQGRRRASGVSVTSAAALLAITGYMLYYFTGSAHDAASITHEVAGACAIVVALIHWWRLPQ